jgi:hypothetical protein
LFSQGPTGAVGPTGAIGNPGFRVEEIYYADCFIHVQTFCSYDWQNKNINLEMVLNFNFRVVKVLLVKLVKQESQVHR